MQPLQFNIYKGKLSKNSEGTIPKFGALQFSLKYPDFKEGQKYPNEGCVFVNMTNATAPDVYDWANKIVLALSVTDLGKVLYALRSGTEAKIYHDPNMGSENQGKISKGLNFSSPGGLEKGFMITGTQTSEGVTKKATVPLTPDEVTVLANLIAAAIPLCLGWN